MKNSNWIPKAQKYRIYFHETPRVQTAETPFPHQIILAPTSICQKPPEPIAGFEAKMSGVNCSRPRVRTVPPGDVEPSGGGCLARPTDELNAAKFWKASEWLI